MDSRWLFAVCLAARVGLAVAAKLIPLRFLPWMGAAALVPAIGFFVIFAMGWRKTGAEVGGKRIWWNALRPVHGLLFLSFALLAFWQIRRAYLVLVADVVLGAVAFAVHHAQNA